MRTRAIRLAGKGQFQEALSCLNRALEISEALGDQLGVAYAIGNIGGVYRGRGEYARALECFERWLAIGTELGERDKTLMDIGNQVGLVHFHRREFGLAIQQFERWLQIAEKLGNRSAIALATGNLGTVYTERLQYTEALACYERWLAISEELGNAHVIDYATANIAGIHTNNSEWEKALPLYDRSISITKQLGDIRLLSMNLANVGAIYYAQKEYEKSLEAFMQSQAGLREIGFRFWLTYSLDGMIAALLDLAASLSDVSNDEMPAYLSFYIDGSSGKHWKQAMLDLAQRQAEECVAISEELNKADTLLGGKILLARIDVAAGRGEEGFEKLQAALNQTTNDPERAEIHYWFWKLADLDSEMHRIESLRLFDRLLVEAPQAKFEPRVIDLRSVREGQE